MVELVMRRLINLAFRMKSWNGLASLFKLFWLGIILPLLNCKVIMFIHSLFPSLFVSLFPLSLPFSLCFPLSLSLFLFPHLFFSFLLSPLLFSLSLSLLVSLFLFFLVFLFLSLSLSLSKWPNCYGWLTDFLPNLLVNSLSIFLLHCVYIHVWN